MSRRTKLCAPLLAAALIVAGCGSDSSDTSNEAATTTEGPVGVSVPETAHQSCSADVITTSVPGEFSEYGFDRYYELEIDGHVVMRYLFQPTLTKPQIEHIVRTTNWYLTDVAGSTYGADKSAVISTLAANNATMVIPDGSHTEGQDLGVEGQELYFNEIAAPGSAWYVENDEEHRDATLEEVFHQVHDAGIGTNEPGALPEYQAAMLAEAERAVADGRWAAGATDWIADLTQEGSLAQEYIASVIDNYYGLWAHNSEGSGYYLYGNRSAVTEGDPAGTELLRQFLGDTVEVEAYLDPAFTGTFTLTKSEDAPYSNKSQYLRGARLTGTNPSGIVGNSLDNTVRGNSADNTLDGGDGNDTAIYCNAASQYTVTNDGSSTTVSGPDGTDVLINIETIHFADGPQPNP